MSPAMRWLLGTSMLLVMCAPLPAAQSRNKPQQSNRPARQRTAHPSHPMRNARPKHHAQATAHASLLAVRYLQPQQAGSTASAKSASPTHSKASRHSTSASSSSKKKSKKSRHHRESTQKAPTPERISEIQSSLARGGYYQGEPNGKWDASTVSAMQKFQAANGLDPSGKLDAASLQKLGLGSGIAGVSAPKPPCCSTSPGQTGSCCSRPGANSAPAAPTPAPAAGTSSNPASSKAADSGSTSASNAAGASASSATSSSASGASGAKQ